MTEKVFTVLDGDGDLVEMTRSEMIDHLVHLEMTYTDKPFGKIVEWFESFSDGELVEYFETLD